ncbi:MAG: DEAD/DEAH box helicase [Candidatus Sericytochromatia bacterium]|nr:DEAD/DEAH box helicase [Candidatus Sericytochromatia bacterium]
MLTKSRINPITTSEDLRENYLSFLTSSFSLRNPDLADQFKRKVRESLNLFKGPILQANPHYRSGKTLAELAQDPHSGVSPALLELAPTLSREAQEKALPIHRPLYIHQEQALLQASQGENIIVATGTGSGKTESFLFPIVNHLLQERHEKGHIGPGVRAILIYPMNALANDQIKRLREMMPPETGITFGRYTGQTAKEYADAVSDYKRELGADPQSNELLSRSQIQHTPPHILLTNYAMLEYLLLRPEDAKIFENGQTWKFIVLDEAHTYKGAMGTEIGYLMRKVKDRVAGEKSDRIQCIATSATIGNENSPTVREEVTQAVGNLFGSTFKPHNLIFADKIPAHERFQYSCWGSGQPEFYQLLHEVLSLDANQLKSSLEELLCDQLTQYTDQPGYPDQDILDEALNKLAEPDTIAELRSDVLFELLKGDQRVHELAYALERKPSSLNQLSKKIFSDFPLEAESALVQLTDLATAAHDPQTRVPLLMARYHFFVKSMEGLSIAFPGTQSQNLLIGRFSESPDATETIPAFELKNCIRCGSLYLNGQYEQRQGKKAFVSYPPKKILSADTESKDIVYTIDLQIQVESCEDDLALADNEGQDENSAAQVGTSLNDTEWLCVHCGILHSEIGQPCCQNQRLKAVNRVVPTGQGNHFLIKTCPACGGQRKKDSIIHSFRTNENAAAFMLGRTLFQHTPLTIENSLEPTLATLKTQNNPWASLKPNTQNENHFTETGKRRLLAFSDSRMDAAYFAIYMQTQASKILHRQLILSALKELEQKNPNEVGFTASSLIEPVLRQAVKARVFQNTEFANKQMVSYWLFTELCSLQARQNLEGTGLVHWILHPRVVQQIKFLYLQAQSYFEPYGINEEQLVLLIQQFLVYLRKRSVVGSLDNQPNYTDSYLWPRNRPYSLNLNMGNSAKAVATWLASGNRHNGRTEFLQKFWSQTGKEFEFETAEKLLELTWNMLQSMNDENPFKACAIGEIWEDFSQGSAFQLNPDLWLATTRIAESGSEGCFRCNLCGNLSSLDLLGICSSYRCHGRLERIDPEKDMAQNYYRRLYLSDKQIPINIAEHTAQITTKEGAQRQQNFIDDRSALNMLSCSTTFELGVDVGQLHAVFMRNVPPSVANYVQRAGRAARRLDATAYILTFCRARSHDLAYFEDVEALVGGHVQPPHIPGENIDIARRHLHSVVLEKFFKTYPYYFNGPENKERGQLRWSFFTAPGKDICSKMSEWLQTRPDSLQQALRRIFSDLILPLGIDNWQWISQFVRVSDATREDPQDDNQAEELDPTRDQEAHIFLNWDGILGRAQAELYSEYLEYTNWKKDPKEVHSAERQINRILEIKLLNYFPARGVLPKYGFPVDVVSLELHSVEDWAKKIQLQRDLRMAISEFAPGCQLVANGRVITSYGLQTVRRKAWREYHFHVCKNCGRFERSQTKAKEDKVPEKCECGNYQGYKSGTFVIPEFGFTTAIDQEPEIPVEQPPKRTFATQVFFSSYDQTPVAVAFNQANHPLHLKTVYSPHGKLVVINDNNGKKFHICRYCGFGDRSPNPKGTHKTPFGKMCKNGGIHGKGHFLAALALGHEFKTDVLELRVSGPSLGLYEGQDLWLSVLSALIRGACRALDIEEENLDGALGNFSGGEYRSLILYDTFPGGAGFVKLIPDRLKAVIENALEIAENCTACSENQSCNACLRRYQNQFAHDLLKRGPAAEFLREFRDTIFTDLQDGFYPPGYSTSEQWLKNQLQTSRSITLVLAHFQDYASKMGEWYKLFSRAAQLGCQIHLILADPEQNFMNYANALQVFPLLGLSIEGIKISTFSKKSTVPFQAMFEHGHSFTLARWAENQDAPFSESDDRSLLKKSVSPKDPMLSKFKTEIGNLKLKNWSFEDLKYQLQAVRYIDLKIGELKNWHDLLESEIPVNTLDVYIYDRFIRHTVAFESVKNFLEMINQKAKQFNRKINIRLETTYGENLYIQNKNQEKQDKAEEEKKLQEKTFFSELREQSKPGGCFEHLLFTLLKTQQKTNDKKIQSHKRYIEINKDNGKRIINIEKGFDILQKNRNGIFAGKFQVTEDSYLVCFDENG